MQTIKIKFHNDDSGNCRTTFKEVGRNKYYNRLDSGGWYTVYPSNGYWESCDRVKDDMVFEIVDFEGNTLFTESNANLGAFISLSDKAKQITEEFRERLSLTTREEWHKWLESDMEAFSYNGYVDNWLHFEVKALPGAGTGEEHGHPLEEYSHLGMDFVVRAVSHEHKICGKKWVQVAIFEKKENSCVAICGYIL